jgi:hypothetical protein
MMTDQRKLKLVMGDCGRVLTVRQARLCSSVPDSDNNINSNNNARIDGINVVAEIRVTNLNPNTLDSICKQIVAGIPCHCNGVKMFKVTLVSPRTIPKTSSGKIQCSLCKKRDLKGDF